MKAASLSWAERFWAEKSPVGRSARSCGRRPGLRLGLLVVLAGFLSGGCATVEAPDPWERVNRGTFLVNETLDKYAIEPVATAWDFVVPGFVQTGISNFYDNLDMPVVLANDLLQGKPEAALFDVTRFLINSTFGIGGLFDLASQVGVPDNDEDFGQTLAVWGVPSGPYFVIPILGPSTVRDSAGLVVDTLATSWAYFTPFWYDVAGLNGPETFGASTGFVAFELMNLRAIFLEEIEGSRADAFDYYIFVRNAYLQNRRAKVKDQVDGVSEAPADLYDSDFDEDEDEEDFDDF